MRYNINNVEQLRLDVESMKKKDPQAIMEVLTVEQVLHERAVQYDTKIRSSTHAGKIGIKEIGNCASETVLMLALDTKLGINAMHKVFTGTLNSSVAHPREIFRTAILNNAAQIIIYHNHPSGNLDPSDADLSFTERMVEIGELLGIRVVDHIIVSNDNYYSLKEHEHMS